jgi:hypothetical protein
MREWAPAPALVPMQVGPSPIRMAPASAPCPMWMAPAPAPTPIREASQPVFGKLSVVGKQRQQATPYHHQANAPFAWTPYHHQANAPFAWTTGVVHEQTADFFNPSGRECADISAIGVSAGTANPSSAPTTTLIEEVGAEEVLTVDNEESAADAPRSGACDQHVKQAVLTLQCATRCWLSSRAFENSFADLFARAASASAAAAHASEAQGGPRKLSFDATAALLEALALDGSIVTFIAYNDFGYKGRYAVPKAGREYWLKISRDKLPTLLREKFPGLLVADDLVIMHVYYEGDYPWPENPSRPKVHLQPPFCARLVITQINVRHTWQGSGPKPSYPCRLKDLGGTLHGLTKESSGQAVLVADTGWNWTDTKEKRKSFGSCMGKHTACLQDLLVKGENYADHGGRKVRKKIFGFALSPSDDGAEDGMGLKSIAAGGARGWTETDWSAKADPAPVRRPVKILFVGVNESNWCNGSQLDLKKEQKAIQHSIDRYFNDSKTPYLATSFHLACRARSCGRVRPLSPCARH